MSQETMKPIPSRHWIIHLCCSLLLLSVWIYWAYCSEQLHQNNSSLESFANSAVNNQQSCREHANFCKFQRSDYFNCDTVRVIERYSIFFSCDNFLHCTLSKFPRVKMVNLPDLDTFTDKCANRSALLTNGNTTVSQAAIQQLFIYSSYITHFPADYFCKLTNVTRIRLIRNVIVNTRNFGFNALCNSRDPIHCCACNLNHLDLRANRLQVVGNASFCAMPNLETLDLCKNVLSEVNSNGFVMLAKLQKLKMNENQLKLLSANVFRPLTNLVHLEMSYNKLNEEVFRALHPLLTLKVLHLSFNRIAFIGNDSFGNSLSSLIELHLDGNALTSLGTGFSGLRKMQTIDFRLNKLMNISDSAFDLMEQLTEVNLGLNWLQSLPNRIFSKNAHLRKLDLTRNWFESIPNLNSKSLEMLILVQNQIKNITTFDQENLCQLKNLKYLNLSSNFMKTIVPHVFDCNGTNHNKSVLRLVDLSSNKLRSFCLSVLPPNLVELLLRFNQFNEFPFNSEILQRQVSLKKLDLSHNRLRDLTDVTLPPNLEVLNLANNQLEVFSFAKKTNGHEYAIPANLQLVNLENNNLEIACPLILYEIHNDFSGRFFLKGNPMKCTCERNYFEKLLQLNTTRPVKNLRSCPNVLKNHGSESAYGIDDQLVRMHVFSCSSSMVNCQCNSISSYSAMCRLPCPERCECYIDLEFTKYFMNCSSRDLHVIQQVPMHPQFSLVLQFSANHLMVLESATFAPYPLAVELYLQNNALSTIMYGAFQNMKNLELLNLEENLLEELPAALFKGLNKLTELYLAKNRLMHLYDGIFHPLIILKKLELQGNLLTNFSVWKFQERTALSSLKLGHNPWSCNCDYIERFQDWLQNATDLVIDASDLFCTPESEPVKRHPLQYFIYLYCHAGLPASASGSITPIWTSVVSVFIFLTSGSILLFVYRREMQVLIYARYGVRLFAKTQEADEGKVYDAFLAYSSHDVEFVARQLVPGLEKIEKPYKLCIHERDFLCGANITESILEAVERSRRTIVVLSPNFVASGYCVFEFKSAHFQMLSDRCSRIIVILLGDVPPVVDPEIKLYLKTNTYLRWDDKHFWKKLYFALPDRKVAETSV